MNDREAQIRTEENTILNRLKKSDVGGDVKL
jgi:hypothetical protein